MTDNTDHAASVAKSKAAQTIIPARSAGADVFVETLMEWCLVIAFHPDTTRIGEICRVPQNRATLMLGRHEPLFAHPGEVAQPLGDQFVSRRACELSLGGGNDSGNDSGIHSGNDSEWVLARASQRSHLRINGRDELESVRLSRTQLGDGIVLTLGTRVVLFLRLEPAVREPGLPATDVPELQGVSQIMAQLRRAVRRAAESPGDILLLGPTGSGKEQAARAIHRLGAGDQAPWVAVNMAALPAEIAAASLFGVRRGAYTGADSHRPGFFQQAAGGTLFLDEVGDTPETVQPQLLRALQERELQVVGGPSERVSLRVVSATERDPDTPESAFRASLRFRLGAQEIRMPALAERREDIGALAADCFRQLAHVQALPWGGELADDPETARWARCFELMLLYAWPGNVRELRHRVAQIAAASEERLTLPPAVLECLRTRPVASSEGARASVPKPLQPPGDGHATQSMSAHESAPVLARAGPEESGVGESAAGTPRVTDPRVVMASGGSKMPLASLPDHVVREAWVAAGFEVAALARALGVSRAAIYRRLKTLKECRLAADVPLGELLAALDDCRGDLAATAKQLSISRPGLEARLRISGVQPPGHATGEPKVDVTRSVQKRIER